MSYFTPLLRPGIGHNAVEKGRIPLHQAPEIASEDGAAVQVALAETYESGVFSGNKLVMMQRIIARRKQYDKSIAPYGVDRSQLRVLPFSKKGHTIAKLFTDYFCFLAGVLRMVLKNKKGVT